MNKELLNTPILKNAIVRYLEEDLSLKEILDKLFDIHLIIITEKELKDFILTNELNKQTKHL